MGFTFYTLSISQPHILAPWHLSSWQLGLAYVPFGISDVVGSILGGYASDRSLQYAKRRYGEHGAIPESRIFLLFISIPITIISVNGIGWLMHFEPNLLIITIIQSLICTSMTFSFCLLTGYVLDYFPTRASSIGATCTLLRSLSAGLATSLTSTFDARLGLGWSFTILGFIHLLGIIILSILLRNCRKYYLGEPLPA
ncbi:Dityrosine transporter 1 [Massospora cicadina]|nr:Dityrosine transporter 1 [Massospora cicadina]